MKLLYHILFIGFNFNFLVACTVCYGDSNEPAVKAANLGILFLLGIILFVLSCFGLFIYNLHLKSKKVKIKDGFH